MSDKVKYPRVEAIKVARFVCLRLADHCTRLICAGSLRRRKPMVGDVEILYIPDFKTEPDGLFDQKQINQADVVLDELLASGILSRRRNAIGSEMWGPKNKLAVHVPSGIPVDFFSATESNWFNYLVCRTGGADNNMAIASAAQRKGWKWNPYGEGFTNAAGEIVPVRSEADVFALVGMDYKQPWERL